jgi:hypothetical protein
MQYPRLKNLFRAGLALTVSSLLLSPAAHGESSESVSGDAVLVAEIPEDESVEDIEHSEPLRNTSKTVAPNLDLKEIAPQPAEQELEATTVDANEPEELAEATNLNMLGSEVRPGTSTLLAWSPGIQIAGLGQPTPVLVVNGANAGPTLCLTGAVHGDELNGIEIIRRTMYDLDPEKLSGSVVGVPIVNLPGFQQGSRYLPDRRVIGMAVDQVVMAGFAAYHIGTEAEVPGE